MNLPGPTSHSFVSQRLQVRYIDWGNPEAPLLILQHGGLDHGRSWDWVAQRLRGDWHVVCPDLRGHGDSAWSPDGDYAMDQYVYDFVQFVEKYWANSGWRSVGTRWAAISLPATPASIPIG